jgi:hypothetical protein
LTPASAGRGGGALSRHPGDLYQLQLLGDPDYPRLVGELLAGAQEQRAAAVIDEKLLYAADLHRRRGSADLPAIGPVATWLSQLLANGYQIIYTVAPWLAGAAMGALWQVCVIFGLHWGLIP